MKKDKTDKILDNIESYLKELPSAQLRGVARELIMFIAIIATGQCDNDFAFIKLLDEAKKELVEEMDRAILNNIGEMCIQEVKKKKVR